MERIPEPENTPEGPAYEGRLLVRPDDEVVDQGAGFDITTMVSRRGILGLVGLGAGALTLAACSATASTGTSATATATTTPTSSATPSASATTETPTLTLATTEIAQETNGPYPADGSNGVNVLDQSGIVRSDIRTSLDGGATAAGVPLTFTFTLSDLSNGNAPLAGAAVYIWHCDAQGLYSMYSQQIIDETYLRGIQVADANGQVTFTTVVPGCYMGRWTHIHFEVYPDAASAINVSNQIATSQVAFPQDMLDQVYALAEYDGSASNLASLGGIDNDNVFGDGYATEMGTFSGSTSAGYIGSLPVAIDPTTTAAAAGGRP